MSKKVENKPLNVYGGQVNIANGNATITATQNQGVCSSEINELIKSITNNLSEMSKDNQKIMSDVLEMVKEEFSKNNPKKSRLRNCVTLLAPMVTIAKIIPDLDDKIQALIDLIKSYI